MVRKHGEEKQYHCPENGCARAFGGGSELSVHLRDGHGNYKDWLKCRFKECEKSYRRKENLQKHENEHLAEAYKSIQPRTSQVSEEAKQNV